MLEKMNFFTIQKNLVFSLRGRKLPSSNQIEKQINASKIHKVREIKFSKIEERIHDIWNAFKRSILLSKKKKKKNHQNAWTNALSMHFLILSLTRVTRFREVNNSITGRAWQTSNGSICLFVIRVIDDDQHGTMERHENLAGRTWQTDKFQPFANSTFSPARLFHQIA